MPTLIIFGLLIFTDMNYRDIGLVVPSFSNEYFGDVISLIAISLGVIYLLLLIFVIISFRVNPKFRKGLMQQKEKQTEEDPISVLLPITKKEKKTWSLLSLTAGITEEILYRGFLIYAISSLLPDLSIWIVAILSSVLFGLAHTYQGAPGVIKTSFVGFLFALLYLSTGSIIPVIILHFLIDYVAKLDDKEK